MKTKGINILSLFNGMSCGRIALERAEIEVDNYYSSEINKYALQVANENYPQDEINILGDVRLIDFTKLPKIDLLTGGSPCQNFSFSGKRNGMTTKENIEILSLSQYLQLKSEGFEFSGQSYLFWEYMRALKEIKPKYFLLENVVMVEKWRNVLTEAIGIDPIEINSSLVSAQNRRRLYWTNIPDIKQPEDKSINLEDILDDYAMKNPSAVRGRRLNKATILGRRLNKNGKREDYNKDIPITQCLEVRATNTNKSNCLTTVAKDNVLTTMPIGRHPDAFNKKLPFRYYTLKECCKLQTVPEDYFAVCSENQARKMLGNGWTVDVIAHIFKGIK